jgi:hypothetical protein
MGPRTDKRVSLLDILLPRLTEIYFRETLVQPERLEPGQVLRSHFTAAKSLFLEIKSRVYCTRHGAGVRNAYWVS